ncbi:hypothetical protein HA630_00350, partial [Aquabacterium sp. A08]|nr:hypothetical protein [Aquabacterium sp. A08]NIC39517.1 hypothetical protein [Aquabacterium sp. A08]
MVKRSASPPAQAPLLRPHAPAPGSAARRDGPAPAPTARRGPAHGPVLVPPGLREAPVLDLMCSRLALTLAARQGGRFNLRRDLPALLALAGRHLVWPATVLRRLRSFLEHRCRDHDWWRGQAALGPAAFLARHGVWQGPYEEETLFFHLDDYAKEAP